MCCAVWRNWSDPVAKEHVRMNDCRDGGLEMVREDVRLQLREQP